MQGRSLRIRPDAFPRCHTRLRNNAPNHYEDPLVGTLALSLIGNEQTLRPLPLEMLEDRRADAVKDVNRSKIAQIVTGNTV
jgi:hypothetical protein